MLQPKSSKYSKQFKNSKYGITFQNNKIIFGTFALKTTQTCRLTSQQIEACRLTILKKMNRLGFLWVRVFPHTPVTSKPTEVRMGKGKGLVDFWAAKIRKGQILYEISGLQKKQAFLALTAGSKKLPIKSILMEKKGL